MWKYFGILLTLAVVAKNYVASQEYESRIIGGQEEFITTVPYMVSIRYKKNETTPYEHRCSGTIYSANTILTTATCVIGLDLNRLHIKAGSSFRTQFDGSLFLVEKYVIHPDFNIWFTDYDLALIKLAFDLTPYPSKEIKAIEIADQLPAANRMANVAGWGTTNPDSNTEFSEQIKMAKVVMVEDEICREIYGGSRISEVMFCAAAATDLEDACYGDAGGALVYQNKAIGLVSWGRSCGDIKFPGVYTKLVLFKTWIDNEISKF
uniref:Putative trypsin alpha-3-like protein n=1 Tax=Haematobia irritans TaxID=7368 RepID=A0A1L8EIZ1_HAEIR